MDLSPLLPRAELLVAAAAPDDPVELVLRALAAGWSAKWT